MKKQLFSYTMLIIGIINHDIIQPFSYFFNSNAIATQKLIDSIQSKNAPEALKAIDQGADINKINENELTPLMLAINADLLDVALRLIDRNANVHAIASKTGDTALAIALAKNNQPIIQALKAKGAQVIYPKSDQKNSGWIDKIPDEWIRKIPGSAIVKAPKKVLDTEKRIALRNAMTKKNIKEIDTLIQSGADLNTINDDGGTPLISAIALGNDQLAKKIIQKGADVNKATSAGVTPLLLAISKKHTNIALELLNAGANVDASASGITPLRLAIDKQDSKVAEKLIKLGADVNANTVNKETLLMLAINQNLTDVALLLINRGANIHAVDKDGSTPLLLATLKNNQPIILKLIENGADINTVNNYGYTPVMVAITTPNFETAALLIAHGANTPLISAFANHYHTNFNNFMDDNFIKFAIKYRDMIKQLHTDLNNLEKKHRTV